MSRDNWEDYTIDRNILYNEMSFLLSIHALLVGADRLMRRLLTHYGSPRIAWESSGQWSELPFFAHRQMQGILRQQKKINPEQVYDKYLKAQTSIVTLFDDDYPELLAEIYSPPLLIFYKGMLPKHNEICVALIGSRRASAYGIYAGKMLSEEIGGNGISIVSGMARGIDSACHEGALKIGAKTYAVLGSGVNIIYPRENEKLYNQIIEQGAVLSEQPIDAEPLARNFPSRNRIISGLSRGVVVVEAGDRSGTFLTAEYALSQNRDVFAVPGPITSPSSKGTNRLLCGGCKAISEARDIWGEYIIEAAPPILPLFTKDRMKDLSPEERDIASLMVLPVHFDQLCEQLEMSASDLAAKLTLWEIRGLIEQLPGKNYISKIGGRG